MNDSSLQTTTRYRRLPHWLALFSAFVTWPLLISGARVTTNRVGMAVPDWPTTFGVNMLLYNMFDAPWGVYVEHSHRLCGMALGFATIALAVVLGLRDQRRWAKILGIVALLAVIGQGLLGGTRVLRNSTTFAAIHGTTGQMVFALMVAVCVLTSRDWIENDVTAEDRSSFRVRALLTSILILGQIAIGASLRHFQVGLVLHASLAVAVFAMVVGSVVSVERNRRVWSSLVWPSRFMAFCVANQVALGIAAWWVLRPFDGIARPVTVAQAIFRSGHVVNGAFLFGSSVILTLRAFRHLQARPRVVEPTRETNPGLILEAVL